MGEQMRIAEVVERTGVSRELIHHYLRQGLLPPSPARAAYSDEQVRLLQQIKALRDEHHLPLEIIRAVFAFFRFDPDRLEALTLSDSFARRMARLAESGDALSTRALDRDALSREARLPPRRLATYEEAGLVRPVGGDDEARFSTYDARVLAVCERAIAQGVPFEALRTIASFVRTAFELEHPLLFPALGGQGADAQTLLGEVVVRLELVTSLIQSLLQGLVAHRLRDVSAGEAGEAGSLDHLVYRPSDGFLRRHGLEAALAGATQRLGDAPGEPTAWRRAVHLLLHAGRYAEAVFFAEQAHARFPGETSLTTALGRALIAVGQRERGRALLAEAPGAGARILEALATLAEAGQGAVDLQALAPLPEAVERALAAAEHEPPHRRLEIRLLAGGALTALPSALRRLERGLALLRGALAELEATPKEAFPLPGQRDRYRINAAWLLHAALGTDPATPDETRAEREALCALVCRLDPGSAFAARIYLDTPAAPAASLAPRGAAAEPPEE